MVIQYEHAGWLFLAMGLMSVVGAALNLDMFMNSPKARPFIDKYGRLGARVVYVFLGLGMMALGGLITTGWPFSSL